MTNMKCVLWKVSLVLFINIAWVKAVPGFQQKVDECKNQTKATEDEVLNILAHRVPRTENEKCMLACLQKKIEFMGTDNKINLNKILKSIELIKKYNLERYERLKTVYEDCAAAELTEPDECMAAFNFAQCVYPKFPKLENGHHNKNKGIFAQECRNKSGANNDEKMNVLQHKVPVSKNEQCMMACMLKKSEQLTSDNKINLAKLTEHLDHLNKINPLKYNTTVKIYQDCKAVEKVEKDECVAAKNFATCVYPKERLIRLGSRMKTMVSDCASQTRASEIEVDNMLTHIIPKQKNEKCLFACIQKKMGNMKGDNTIDVERMKQKMHYLKQANSELFDKISNVLDDCKSKEKKENDECEAGGKFAECVYPKEAEVRKTYMNKPH